MRRFFLMAALVGLAIGLVDRAAAADNNSRQRSGTNNYYFQPAPYYPTQAAAPTRPTRSSPLSPSRQVPPTATPRTPRPSYSKYFGGPSTSTSSSSTTTSSATPSSSASSTSSTSNPSYGTTSGYFYGYGPLGLGLYSYGTNYSPYAYSPYQSYYSPYGYSSGYSPYEAYYSPYAQSYGGNSTYEAPDLLSLLAGLWSGADHADAGGWPVKRSLGRPNLLGRHILVSTAPYSSRWSFTARMSNWLFRSVRRICGLAPEARWA